MRTRSTGRCSPRRSSPSRSRPRPVTRPTWWWPRPTPRPMSIVGGIAAQRAAEEARLADAKQTTATFIGSVRQMCDTQMKHLDSLSMNYTAAIPDVRAAQPAVASAPAAPKSIDDTVKSIEDSVARIQAEPSPSIDFGAVDAVPAADDVPSPGPDTTEDDTQLFMFNKRG
jgi:hypothetical protein